MDIINTITGFVSEHTTVIVIIAAIFLVLSIIKKIRKLMLLVVAIVMCLYIASNFFSLNINPNNFKITEDCVITIQGTEYSLIPKGHEEEAEGPSISSIYIKESDGIAQKVIFKTSDSNELTLTIPSSTVKKLTDMLIKNNIYYEYIKK